MAQIERELVKQGEDSRLPAVSRLHEGRPRNREEIPQKDFLPRFGAGCLIAIGVVIILLGVSDVDLGHGEGVGGAIFNLVLGGGFLVAGIFWYNYVATQERTRRELIEEKALLSVALDHRGSATIAQVALETPFTAAEVEAIMARLCRQGLARPEILPDGTISYRFGGLID